MSQRLRAGALVAACACASLPLEAAADPPKVKVGSKAFTEGVVLGELTTRLCAAGGAEVDHRRQLGGSVILFKALEAGEIDVYVEYTGTLAAELLHLPDARDLGAMRRALSDRGLAMSEPLGFDNTYALGVSKDLAAKKGVATIGQLATHRDLVFGISHELMERADGWPGLQRRYGLAPSELRPMDHDVAYKALAARQIDVMDLYTTDAEIASLGLTVLEDDRGYFPSYRAVIVHRAELATEAPECVTQLRRLEGAISAESMRAMNARVKLEGQSEDVAAAEFLASRLDVESQVSAPTRFDRVVARTGEHLLLTFASLLAATALGVPLGVLCARFARLRHAVLGVAGVVQTVPSLALLVLLIPFLGIGTTPAIAALILYSLFPVVEGTVTGLSGIPAALRESAEALGLSRGFRLRSVELPLASPSIVSGVRTAAVLAVGTATIGAMVGAGGYGQPILTGVRLDSVPMILEGALPAAALAIAVQALFRGVERLVVPRGVSGGGSR